MNPPLNISFAFDGKTHSSPKAIAQAFNRQFTTCSAQLDQAVRRLIKSYLIWNHNHRMDPSYSLFDERGIAMANRKAGTSTAQGPDGLTMLPLRHLGLHGLEFLTEFFNLSIAASSSRWSTVPDSTTIWSDGLWRTSAAGSGCPAWHPGY